VESDGPKPAMGRSTRRPQAGSAVVSESSLELRVLEAINRAPVLDLHTHLFAPQLEGMNLFGIDELLTYHYLIAEVLRFEKVTPEWLLAQPKAAQADLIWKALFVQRTPISEATNGVVTVLTELGLDPAAPNLCEARDYFADREVGKHLDDLFGIAKVSHLAMTNDPLDPIERSSGKNARTSILGFWRL